MDGLGNLLSSHQDIVTLVGFIASLITLLGVGVAVVRAIGKGWRKEAKSTDISSIPPPHPDPWQDPWPPQPKERYRKFFQLLANDVQKKDANLRLKGDAVGTGPSCVFLAGVSGAAYHAHFTQPGTFRAFLYLGGKNGRRLFDELHEQKAALEQEMGTELKWERGSVSEIVAYYPGVGKIGDEPSKLKDMEQWAVTHILKFRDVFVPRLTAALAKVR